MVATTVFPGRTISSGSKLEGEGNARLGSPVRHAHHLVAPLPSSPTCASRPANTLLDWSRSSGRRLSFDAPSTPPSVGEASLISVGDQEGGESTGGSHKNVWATAGEGRTCSAAASSGGMSEEDVVALVRSWEEKTRILMQGKWAIEMDLKRERAASEGHRAEVEHLKGQMLHLDMEIADLHKVVARLLDLPRKKEVEELQEAKRALEEDKANALLRADKAQDEARRLRLKVRSLEHDLHGVALVQAQLMELPSSSTHPSHASFSASGTRRRRQGRKRASDIPSPAFVAEEESTFRELFVTVRGAVSPAESVLSGRNTMSPESPRDCAGIPLYAM